MIDERYTLHQDGNYHTVIDEEKNVPLIMIEFKENEFPVYACFHRIIDLLNEQNNKINDLIDENDCLKKQLNLFIQYDQKRYEEVIFKSEDGDIILYKKRGDFNG